METMRNWPHEEQQALLRDIEERLANAPNAHAATPAPLLSIYDLAGIALAPGQELPSETQVAQWLDERRMKEAE